jgi:hypothetical protein
MTKKTSAVPPYGIATGGKSQSKPVKIATQDLFINDTKQKDADEMAYLLFESFSGAELSTISRTDNVNPAIGSSEGSAYSPISNLSRISAEYNPLNIVSLQGADVNYFNQFPIDLNEYIPAYGNGPSGAIVYADEKTGDIYIDTINVTDVQRVEVEILTISEVIDDTIYMEEQ